MNKIWNKIVAAFHALIAGFQQSDKRLHMYCGFAISLVVGIIIPWCGIIAAMVAGGIKEWWDSRGHGCVEILDFVFTTIGGIIAIPVSLLIHNLIW